VSTEAEKKKHFAIGMLGHIPKVAVRFDKLDFFFTFIINSVFFAHFEH